MDTSDGFKMLHSCKLSRNHVALLQSLHGTEAIYATPHIIWLMLAPSTCKSDESLMKPSSLI